ncbi:MAG: DUF1800 family protein [Verrucomicrobiota bacterium]
MDLPPPSIEPLDGSEWNRDHAAHLLRRASFGGTRNEIDACYALGLEGAVEHLLSGLQPGHAGVRDTGILKPEALLQLPEPYLGSAMVGSSGSEESIRWQNLFTMQMEWLKRAHGPAAPLEKMVMFWHGMLTSSYGTVGVSQYMLQQNALFRDQAFGNYGRLVRDVIVDPAMIRYLDIDKNRRDSPNENFARELLELFTLGEGNYEPSDIKRIAPEFVGFRFTPLKDDPVTGRKASGIARHAGHHDRVKRISPIIKWIFEIPECGELLCERLWRYYLSEEPDPNEIQALAQLLRESNWNVRPVLSELWRSKTFYSEGARLSQIKSPVQLLLQGLRELEVPEVDERAALHTMTRLGQALFQPPNVAGWPGGKRWINTESLSARYVLGENLVDLASVPHYPKGAGVAVMTEWLNRLNLESISDQKRITIVNFLDENGNHIEQLLTYLLCLPEYQLC